MLTKLHKFYLFLFVILIPLSLSSCSTWFTVENNPQKYGKYDHVPQGGGHYKIGEPYQINGIWYYPEEDDNYNEVGLASWYGDFFHGRLTANGEYYDMNSLSAAHKTLPLPSYLRVTNIENKKSIIVRLNDRGPYVEDRIIDLSKRAAEDLGMLKQGTAKVQVQYIEKAPLEGNENDYFKNSKPGFLRKIWRTTSSAFTEL
tara:strand:+ start:2488 stop:3090 length:603 start_codon:yes stop_codon:yes gene_type:complete